MKKDRKVTLADLPSVGRGAAAGVWFRRHWLVVGTGCELRDFPPAVDALGEEMVLFRDDRGRIGLLGLHDNGSLQELDNSGWFKTLGR